jgi:hypothetical protein
VNLRSLDKQVRIVPIKDKTIVNPQSVDLRLDYNAWTTNEYTRADRWTCRMARG